MCGGGSITDAELVRRVLEGSEDAFRRLVRRYERPIFSLLVRLLRDRGTAEDVAQETFVKAHRALSTYDPARKFSSWLFKIAHNTALDHLRRRQLDTVPLDRGEDGEADYRDTLEDQTSEAPDARVRRRDIRQAFEEAVLALRPEYREVVLLRFQHGLSYQDIVEVTNLPLGTVKTNIHRARKALARALRDRGFEP